MYIPMNAIGAALRPALPTLQRAGQGAAAGIGAAIGYEVGAVAISSVKRGGRAVARMTSKVTHKTANAYHAARDRSDEKLLRRFWSHHRSPTPTTNPEPFPAMPDEGI